MTIDDGGPQSAAAASDKAQFHYAVGCAASNLIFLFDGVFDGKPWMMAGAGVSLAAQGANLLLRDKAKPFTAPLLVATGPLFGAQGIQSGNIGLVVFGVFKMAGKAELFYGERLGQRLQRSPGLRFLGRAMGNRSGIKAEALLIAGASGLLANGAVEIAHGVAARDSAQMANGAWIVLGTLAFIAGNRARSRVPHVSASRHPGIGKRPIVRSGPACE